MSTEQHFISCTSFAATDSLFTFSYLAAEKRQQRATKGPDSVKVKQNAYLGQRDQLQESMMDLDLTAERQNQNSDEY